MHIRIPERGRAIVGRALIALILVGALAVCGWLLVSKPQPPAAANAPAGVVPAAGNSGDAGSSQPGAGPSMLEVSAPVQAQAVQQQGNNALQNWANGLTGPLDIPERALVAYANAELTLRNELPNCHLSWVTLAGIGKASTNHGRYGGDSLAPDGVLAKALGPVPLVGAAGEKASDQRSGPMQLTASEFKRGGNVQNIDDAAIAAGRSLCANGTDLQAGQGWWKAIAGYRDSDLFRQQVLGNAQLYATLSLAPQTASAPSVRAVRFALDQLGLPYVWGGNGPDAGAAGFDCSGLTKAAYDSAGVSLPRTADAQYRGEPPAPVDQLKAGDLVFYGTQSFIHHVGLYIGNGLMINAPTQGMAVQIATYHTPGDDFAGAARPAN